MAQEKRGKSGVSVSGLNPFRRATVTVNIEGASLRITASRGRRILAWLNMPFNPMLVDDGQIANQKDLAGVMQTAMRRLGYTPSEVLATYSGARALVRIVTIPHTPGARQQLVLDREARRLLPARAAQNHVFWRRLGSTASEARYLLVAAGKPAMNTFMETLIQAGLRPTIVELKGFALSRLPGVPRALIISLEIGSITSVLVEDYIPEMLAMPALDEAQAFSEDDVAVHVTEEVRAALEFFQQRFPGASTSELPIFFTGGHPLADSGRITHALGEQLGGSLSPVPEPAYIHDEAMPVAAFGANFGSLMR
jgi:hypothetical protein